MDLLFEDSADILVWHSRHFTEAKDQAFVLLLEVLLLIFLHHILFQLRVF